MEIWENYVDSFTFAILLDREGGCAVMIEGFYNYILTSVTGWVIIYLPTYTI